MEALTDKQYRTYQKVSRYSPFPVYYNRFDNKYVSGMTSWLSQENTPWTSYKVKQGDTLDSIALYFYNNPTYYWVLCDFNRILDPFEYLEEGTILKIPTFSRIEFEM